MNYSDRLLFESAGTDVQRVPKKTKGPEKGFSAPVQDNSVQTGGGSGDVEYNQQGEEIYKNKSSNKTYNPHARVNSFTADGNVSSIAPNNGKISNSDSFQTADDICNTLNF